MATGYDPGVSPLLSAATATSATALLCAPLVAAVTVLVAAAAPRAYLRYQRRRLEEAQADLSRAEREGRMLDTQRDILQSQNAIMDALIARGEGARRARQARWRIVQRRMLLRR